MRENDPRVVAQIVSTATDSPNATPRHLAGRKVDLEPPSGSQNRHEA